MRLNGGGAENRSASFEGFSLRAGLLPLAVTTPLHRSCTGLRLPSLASPRAIAGLALLALSGLAVGAAFGEDTADNRSSITEKVLWKFQTGKSIDAVPVVEGPVLYCGSMDGVFYAVDAGSGRELWRFATPQPVNSTAALTGDLVCFESGNTLYGLDKKTGTERWHYAASDQPPVLSLGFTDYHHSSPVIRDGVVYFVDGWGNLNGVDLRSGKPVFHYTTEARQAIRSTPAIAGGVVYFGDWAGDVYAVNLATCVLQWKTRLENTREYYGAVVSPMVIQKGVLYFGSQHDVFTPLDLATGKPVWKYVDPKHTYLPSTPLIHGDQVIVASTIYTLSVFCFGPTGEIVWQCPTDGIGFVTPALQGSVLAINSSNFGKAGSLAFIDVNTGKVLQRLPIERASPSSPVIAGGRLFIGCGDGAIYALDYPGLIKKP